MSTITMKSNKMNTKKILIQVSILLIILLWSYAAFSKLLDYYVFVFHLNQTPFYPISKFMAAFVPITELAIVAMLLFRRTIRIGLLASAALLFVFTAYIIYIMNFYAHTPCSCGGVLQTMTWGQHIAFNVAFMLISIGALLLYRNNNADRSHQYRIA